MDALKVSSNIQTKNRFTVSILSYCEILRNWKFGRGALREKFQNTEFFISRYSVRIRENTD